MWHLVDPRDEDKIICAASTQKYCVHASVFVFCFRFIFVSCIFSMGLVSYGAFYEQSVSTTMASYFRPSILFIVHIFFGFVYLFGFSGVELIYISQCITFVERNRHFYRKRSENAQRIETQLLGIAYIRTSMISILSISSEIFKVIINVV